MLTVDDTYGHLSEVPPPGGSRDDPARMVGNGAVSSPNVDQVALHGGEMLVLCSDGIHKHVEPRELSDVLRGSAPLARRCGRLLALARARGSRDDATVLVVQREPRLARVAILVAEPARRFAACRRLDYGGAGHALHIAGHFCPHRRSPTGRVDRRTDAEPRRRCANHDTRQIDRVFGRGRLRW